MKTGDLVRYCYTAQKTAGPLALVVDQTSPESMFHHRIRVMWLDKDLPIQASALSTSSNRITTWVKPGYFELVS